MCGSFSYCIAAPETLNYTSGNGSEVKRRVKEKMRIRKNATFPPFFSIVLPQMSLQGCESEVKGGNVCLESADGGLSTSYKI